jgi:hypothetical protein
MAYEIELKGSGVEVIADADAYAQEGVLTTFFRSRGGRAVLDSWSKRLASYRTADISRIRWLAEGDESDGFVALSAVEGRRAS